MEGRGNGCDLREAPTKAGCHRRTLMDGWSHGRGTERPDISAAGTRQRQEDGRKGRIAPRRGARPRHLAPRLIVAPPAITMPPPHSRATSWRHYRLPQRSSGPATTRGRRHRGPRRTRYPRPKAPRSSPTSSGHRVGGTHGSMRNCGGAVAHRLTPTPRPRDQGGRGGRRDRRALRGSWLLAAPNRRRVRAITAGRRSRR